MVKKVFKKILLLLLLLSVASLFLMSLPRVLAKLYPAKPPVGYYFINPTILAVYTGLESLADKSGQIPDHVEAIKNIEYKKINGKSLQMDIYQPNNDFHRPPLLVFIHGGGWSHGDRNEYLNYALYFAGLGYMTATVTYRVVKDATYPACVEDITDAVKFIFENNDKYYFNPDKVVLIGGSAGAHLAMLAAYGWKQDGKEADTTRLVVPKHKIKALVEMYGPVDFTTPYARNHPMVTRLMAHSWEETPKLYKEASPIFWVNKNSPPTLILQGTRDNLVPLSQAEQLKHKLDSLSVPNVYKPLPGWPHTMDQVKRVNNYFRMSMRDFFEKYVK